MVSSSRDPIIFIPLKDARDAQFLKDNDAILQQQRRTTKALAFKPPGVLDALPASQNANAYVNALLVQVEPGHRAEETAETIRRWKRLTVHTRTQMEEILVGKLIATLLMAPIFPKYVLLEPLDSVRGFIVVIVICVLSSIFAIRAALKVDPAEAIGG